MQRPVQCGGGSFFCNLVGWVGDGGIGNVFDGVFFPLLRISAPLKPDSPAGPDPIPAVPVLDPVLKNSIKQRSPFRLVPIRIALD